MISNDCWTVLPRGIKNKKSFVKILTSKKWQKVSVWPDGTFTALKNNCKVVFGESPIFTFKIENYVNFDKDNLATLAEDIDSDLLFLQNKFFGS